MAATAAAKYDWTSIRVIQYPTSAFCSRAEHNPRRQRRGRLGTSSSSSSSSSDAAMPGKGAVADRLLTSQLPNEIMIMNTAERPVSERGQLRRLNAASTYADCMHATDDVHDRQSLTRTLTASYPAEIIPVEYSTFLSPSRTAATSTAATAAAATMTKSGITV